MVSITSAIRFVLDDTANVTASTYTITSATVGRLSFAGLTYSNIPAVTLYGSSGGSVFDVNSTMRGTRLYIGNSNPMTDAPANVLNIGAGNLNTDEGLVDYVGAGSDRVNIDDQSATSSETYSMTSTFLSTSGSFAGLDYSGVGASTINGGSASDGFNVSSTASGASYTINAGAGSDTITLGNTSDGLGDINLEAPSR